MSKKKLREWEIPMNLSDKEKKEYGMTINDKLNNTAKPKQLHQFTNKNTP